MLTAIPKSASLFGNSQGELAVDTRVREMLANAIRNCSKSREQIAEEMSGLTGKPITVHMMNAYTAICKEPSRFPACWVQAFCDVTGDDQLQRFLAGPRLRSLIEFAEREVSAAREEQARKRLLSQLVDSGEETRRTE